MAEKFILLAKRNVENIAQISIRKSSSSMLDDMESVISANQIFYKINQSF
jgi:hypothetical protein